MGSTSSSSQQEISTSAKVFPIVYHPSYNVSFFGIEKLHPFDSCKYAKIVGDLRDKFHIIDSEAELSRPSEAISREELQEVHTIAYLDSLNSSRTVASVCEFPPLALLPNSLVQRNVLTPMRFQVQGTILAAHLAYKQGWSINIGGGMHHSAAARGGGWCVYCDLYLAYRSLRKANPEIKKMMIVDLDVHQGNGFSLQKDLELHLSPGTEIFILDAYNPRIYPGDRPAQKFVDRSVFITRDTTEAEYLKSVTVALDESLKTFKPDIIFYNAGTDILTGDPLNDGVCISSEGVVKRDEIVFKAALDRSLPITMMLSGGYSKASAPTIAMSIANLVKTLNLQPLP